MYQFQGHYNDLLVILSVVIALLTIFTALDLTDRFLRSRRDHRYIILISCVLGAGLWTMHMIGMLAMEMNTTVTYHLPMLLFSLVIPFAASYTLLGLISNPRYQIRLFLGLGGLLFSIGILMMHYSGIMAMKLSAVYEQNTLSIVWSVLFALVVAIVVCSFSGKWLENEYNMFSYRKIGLVLLLAGTLLAMHYTAMAGVSFTTTDVVVYSGAAPLVNDTELAIIVTGAFLFIVAVVLGLLYKDRQRVMTAARFYEQRYMALFEFSPDMVLCIDQGHNQMVRANPAFHQKTGYSEQELQQCDNLLFRTKDILVVKEAIKQASQGHSGKLELPVRTKDGRQLMFSSTVFPLISDKQHLVYIVSKDVTELMQYQQELIHAKEEAESAARMKSEFLATMSHEIRTPLNGIIGINQVLSDEMLGAEQQVLLKIQAKSSQALLNVINDVLDLSRLEANALCLNKEPFQLSLLMQECMDLFQVTTRDKELRLSLSVDPSLPDQLLGDSARIRQILVNLIGNAVKFTHSGSVAVTVQPCSPDEGPQCLEFKVRDTGIGIEPDKFLMLFQPFTQLDAAHNRRYPGTGLGLAICRKLVDLMAGDIRAEADVDNGAEFSFRIPLKPVDSVAETDLHKEAVSKGSH